MLRELGECLLMPTSIQRQADRRWIRRCLCYNKLEAVRFSQVPPSNPQRYSARTAVLK